MKDDTKSVAAVAPQNTRRKFLAGAAGASALAFPMIAKGQAATGPTSMRWQSTWPAKDIFHEYANDFAKKVNDMAGGRLKIEVLPSGAVVPAASPCSTIAGTPIGGCVASCRSMPLRAGSPGA